MDYRYSGDVNKLQGHSPVGSGECVALVQAYANAPHTSRWRPGKHVLDAGFIAPGTAIATFSSPTAPYRSAHGNHAALYYSPEGAKAKRISDSGNAQLFTSSDRLMSATFILLASLAITGHAVEVSQCPRELDAGSVQIKSAPGWTGVVPTRLLLSGAGVVVGPPNVEPRADLRGDARTISKYVTETAYSGLAGREKWLVCTYGRGGELEQAYRLPAAADRCIIRVTRNQYSDTDISVSCVSSRDAPNPRKP